MRNHYISGMPGRTAATGGPLRMALSGEKFMHANMILTKHQAEAVLSAMCALSNVGGFLDCRVGLVKIRFESARFITINAIDKIEDFDGISAFAAAYGLA